MNRRERRANDANVQQRKQQHLASPLGGSVPFQIIGDGTGSSGGWGVGNKKSKPATGSRPAINPFIQPKPAGLNVISQTFPSNYYVEWNLSTWRYACDQAIKNGYTTSYATLVSWVFESSAFIQSLFRAIGSPVGKVPFMFVDEKGNELPEWTEELCKKSWQKELRKEVAYSHFWGFTGINFDPINGKIYKYPMQDIDPINRMLRQNTYSFYDGVLFNENDNLLFIQPSTSYENFLGWMQPIARSFIQMNVNKTSWLAAGRRLAFPLMTAGYPQNDTIVLDDGTEINQFKLDAENIVANMDPSKGVVYPYTTDDKGNIVKSVEIEFEKSGTAAKAHDIFRDFNDEEKNEIREFILGGNLTSSTDKNGSRALGEVHEGKLETIIEDIVEFVEAYLNDEYIKKIKRFYKNFPEGGKFVANKAKQLAIEDIQALSNVLTQNGKRLTDSFFEANGLVKEFFEDAPTMGLSSKGINDDEEFEAIPATKSLLGVKKKF